MKTYNETITKTNIKNYFTIQVNTFLNGLDKDADTWHDIENLSLDWNLSISHYSKFKDLYDNENMLKIVNDIISKKTNTSLKELKNYENDIISNILQACDNAYEDDYMTKIFNFTKNRIEKSINESMIDIKYQVLYYSKEDQSLHNEFKYNTSEVRIYIPKSEFNKIRKELNFVEYTDDDVIDNIGYELSFEAINYEYFDHYGNVADYDNWLEAFKDNEDVSYTILKNRKERLEKRKNRIKYYELLQIKNMNSLVLI